MDQQQKAFSSKQEKENIQEVLDLNRAADNINRLADRVGESDLKEELQKVAAEVKENSNLNEAVDKINRLADRVGEPDLKQPLQKLAAELSGVKDVDAYANGLFKSESDQQKA